MSIHEGHRKRMKAEFLAHPDSFPGYKLLELLLFYADPRGDTNPTAHALENRFHSVAGVMDARVEELIKVPGVGEHAAILLKVVKALAGRYYAEQTSMDGVVGDMKEVRQLFHGFFFGAPVERVCLLCMDGKGKNLGVRQIGEGNVNTAEITARNVLEMALSLNASQVIVAHNHVSGLALPSSEDIATTQYLRDLLRQVGITLVDHVIFAADDMVSLRQSGCFS